MSLVSAGAGRGIRAVIMRLATFNLLHGRSPVDGVVSPDRLRGAVAGLDADVLALQEVDHSQPRSGLVDQTALVAGAMGARDAHFVPALVGTPGERWRAAGADESPNGEPTYGIGLASRHPVARWLRIPLGTSRATLPLLVDARRPALIRDEPRVALAAVLEAPAPVGTVVATHLAFTPGANVLQLARLARAVEHLPGPVVILGDLNMPWPVASLVLRCSAFGAAAPLRSVPQRFTSLARTATFPTERPRIQFDHALAGPGTPEVRDARAVPTAVSDHRALVVDLISSGRRPPR
ncbi:endonuclease/exonuclease/phosphatase family metal-dependent hydrolase [Actinomycetospora succinea]|uniref:Endonuclease/exonuclease/phosphatase family metal-dependent hydrolase n=1 Tax=Actinomycetospora succinea TaxID=663603 RepID=A0A4R6VMT6_9PSEU|nr:endonuclease/exonuclease/phosphatase family protein [Actinomycetospora succinea]TDQ60665.1 endonuclease/exonuclease/phosphatase family metal-dependent hydrolase [Actinomycetospora succinea]